MCARLFAHCCVYLSGAGRRCDPARMADALTLRAWLRQPFVYLCAGMLAIAVAVIAQPDMNPALLWFLGVLFAALSLLPDSAEAK
jgi:hypothetical protein